MLIDRIRIKAFAVALVLAVLVGVAVVEFTRRQPGFLYDFGTGIGGVISGAIVLFGTILLDRHYRRKQASDG